MENSKIRSPLNSSNENLQSSQSGSLHGWEKNSKIHPIVHSSNENLRSPANIVRGWEKNVPYDPMKASWYSPNSVTASHNVLSPDFSPYSSSDVTVQSPFPNLTAPSTQIVGDPRRLDFASSPSTNSEGPFSYMNHSGAPAKVGDVSGSFSTLTLLKTEDGSGAKTNFGVVAQTNSTIGNKSDGGTKITCEDTNEAKSANDSQLVDRSLRVGRKKDFVYLEKINGRIVNILRGLELHTWVFDEAEQKEIVDYVYQLQEMGRQGMLKDRTYSEPKKWMRGKGRVTIQFGCCYNYAVDKNGNPPGIIRDEGVDPLPPLFKKMIKRMVEWHVLPSPCVPDSCIVNIYEKGDCIPPHIDHHDFVRPFCTVSFLSECDILFGLNLKIEGPGEFSGPVSISLPVGSVLILNGNGADVAKHCVPGVPSKRISITFRKMDDKKLPYGFTPDPDLECLKPHSYASNQSSIQASSNFRSATLVARENLKQPSSISSQSSVKAFSNFASTSLAAQHTVDSMSGSAATTPELFSPSDFPSLGAKLQMGQRKGI